MTSKTRTKPKNAFTSHTLKWQDRNYLIFAFFFKIGVSIFILSAMGVIFIFGFNYLTQCHYFKTPKVAFFKMKQGTRLFTPSQLLAIAQIEASVNVLAVNLKRTRKLLLSNPWIAEATVTRRIPSKLTIHVVEHKPLAILDFVISDQSNKYIINEHGKIFTKLSIPGSQSSDAPPQLSDKAIIAELPIIKGLDYSDLDVSGQPSGVQFDAVMEMLHLGQEADAFIPNKDIKNILVDKEVGLTLYTKVHFADVKINAVRIGYKDYTAKLARLRMLINYLRRQNDVVEFDLLDMANLSRITARPIYIKERISGHNET